MAEAALTLPVVVLISLAMVNLSLAWFVAISASNAANYGARIGSVVQSNPVGYSVAAAQSRLDVIHIGSYSVTGSGGGFRGAQINVTVNWTVPNYMGSLLSFFGGTDPVNFHGTALSTFRQEGW
jgi:hypothetical protein